MKKPIRLIAVILAAILMLAVSACTAKSAFEFDSDAAVARAKEVINTVNSKDYEAIYNAFGENYRKLLTVDAIQAGFQPFLDPAGAFVEYKSAEAVGTIDKDGKKYINVYVKTEYENKTHVYNIVFDTDLNLEGFVVVS